MPSLTLARSPRTRRLTAVAAAVILGLSLNACTDQVGSAATVNGQRIDESFVSATTAALTAGAETPPGNNELQFRNRQVLTNQIRHDLITQAAAAEKLTVDEAQVNATTSEGAEQLLQVLGGGYTEAQVPQAVRDTLLVLQLAQRDQGKKATDVQVKADIISGYANRAEAIAARERFLADPAAMKTALTAAAAEQKGGTQSISLLTQPQYAGFGLYTEPVGSIVLVDIDNGASLARITERKVVESDQLATNIQNATGADQFALAWLALASYVRNEPVTVNPRFGVWDPVALQVVPAQSGI
ncbi:SurA N-terminal domain-containing protein [Nakamurella lactea]|uniref:hypothetical protein n=1 Tax=Nakamurella lactea TaxID=459515 RepID=UPI0003FD3023|nr:hypothetical protein [Nakamurella lactea]